MLDFCRGRHPWAKMLRLLEWLPWDSAYARAVADDPDAPAPPVSDGPPSIRSWDRYREMTAVLHDVLETVRVAALVAPGNLKPGSKPKPRPFPRPVTAGQRAERRDAVEQHRKLTALVLPGRG